jgi:hypothetical protein
MAEYKFIDGLFYLGNPYMKKGLTAEDALAIMDEAGIEAAVVCTEEQSYYAPDSAMTIINEMLGVSDRFYGLYPMLPDCAGDLPPFEEVVKSMAFKRYAGLVLIPIPYHIPLHPVYLKDIFDIAEKRDIPVWYHVVTDNDYTYAADILTEFPKLTMVLSFEDEWPNNRKVYPLIRHFANTYLATCNMIWMEAYEDFTRHFGADRLIFATRSPVKYAGAAMYQLHKAEISDGDKAKIAGTNLLKLIGGIKRD